MNQIISSSEKFIRIQQQFKEYAPFEQLCAVVELTRSFQISYRHFLIQLYQINIHNENNVMFNHTVEDANSPDIVTCLLSNNLDKILFTIQLYLPLISTDTFDEKLLMAYRDVLIHLDTNLSPRKFSYTESQLISFAQQVFFYIQINPNLKKLVSYIPKLINLIQTETFHPEEQQQHRQPLQRFASIRSQVPPLMNFSSEGAPNGQMIQQLTRHETNDSGVDLSEPSMNNPLLSFSSSHNSKHPFLERHPSSTTTFIQKKHSFIGKTASSPIPEHATLDTPVRVPLTGVLSAPPPSTHHSDSRHRNPTYQQQESHKQIQTLITEQNQPTDTTRPLGQFYSLRYRNIKNANTDDVSQYLDVDANSASVINTFTQSSTGMKDVPKWLKYLRLHKYDVFFSQMTYDEMMNLTTDKLKASGITDGACTKIALNIKKLKERSMVLKQYLVDLVDGQIELPSLIPQLMELMITPIRSKQLANENQSEEDLPKLIVEVLEKIFQQLPSYAAPEVYHSLLLLVDRCYKHEAFNEYAHLFLQWRRRLSNLLQSFGRIDYKPNPSLFAHSVPARRSIRPSVRPMKSSSIAYHSNYSSNSVTLSKYNSEPQNNYFNESNFVRYSSKPSNTIYPTNEESSDIRTSTSPSNQGAYLAENQHSILSRKASIDPSGEHKTKLCKTYSDPHRIRVQNLPQSSIRSQQNLIRMISTPYSQQPRQFMSRSPPTVTIDTFEASPIKKCHSDNEGANSYQNLDDPTSSSNTDSDDLRHNNAELDSFCRQITENAIGDDVNDSSMDVTNIKSLLNHSTDMEQ